MGVEQLDESAGEYAEVVVALGGGDEQRLGRGGGVVEAVGGAVLAGGALAAFELFDMGGSSICWPRSNERGWVASTVAASRMRTVWSVAETVAGRSSSPETRRRGCADARGSGPEKAVRDCDGKPFAIESHSATDGRSQQCAPRQKSPEHCGWTVSQYDGSDATDASSNDGRGTMNGQTETVRLKVCSDAQTTQQIVNAARVQRTAYNQAIEWQVEVRKVLSVEALKTILNEEKAKGNPRLKNGHGDLQYGGLVRASGRFLGWTRSPDEKRTDSRIPYESTERAERHRRVQCQTLRGVEITDHGTFQITGLGELHIVGGVRRRGGWLPEEVSIHETNREGQNGAEGSNLEREFIALMTLTVEDRASAPRPALEGPAERRRVGRNGGETEGSGDNGGSAADERQNRWTRRKGRRQKQGSVHAAHTDTDGRQRGRARHKGGTREWDVERY